MPLLQPGSRSPIVQARLAREAAAGAAADAGAASTLAATAQSNAVIAGVAAVVADGKAVDAKDRAEDVRKKNAIGDSYTIPSSVLSSTDAGGGHATIHVDAHVRRYTDPTFPDVAFAARDLTGLPNAQVTGVFYDDTTLANAAVGFQTTINLATAQVGKAPGRHALGSITTAAAGASTPTSGGGYTPPGGTVLRSGSDLP